MQPENWKTSFLLLLDQKPRELSLEDLLQEYRRLMKMLKELLDTLSLVATTARPSQGLKTSLRNMLERYMKAKGFGGTEYWRLVEFYTLCLKPHMEEDYLDLILDLYPLPTGGAAVVTPTRPAVKRCLLEELSEAIEYSEEHKRLKL